MRTQVVLTNLTCNLACTYCTGRAPAEDPRFVAGPAVRRRLEAAMGDRRGFGEADPGGTPEIVLSGGEPTLRRDLAALVDAARRGGASRVVLETNATVVDARRAAELAAAGLSLARVTLARADEGLDAIAREAGTYRAAIAGIRAFLGAGTPVEIAVTLVRSSAGGASELPARLRDALVGLEGIEGVVVRVPVESPVPEELLSFAEASAALEALSTACKREGLALRMAPGSGPPPCVFEPRARPAHLYSLTGHEGTRPGHFKADVCSTCLVEQSCPGLSRAAVDRFGLPQIDPVVEERGRRRLSLVGSVREQIARELVTPNLGYTNAGLELEDIIRVNFHCNQSCRFCFVSTHLPAAEHEAIVRAIEAAAAAGKRITLSGGEPTLSPRLLDYVRLARQRSDKALQLQTNAVRLDDPALVTALEEAGLDEAFVSLHGPTAAISDAVTEAPGTFARSVIGIDHLARSRIKLILNFVICETNLRSLVDQVRLVADRWPNAYFNVSFVAPSTDVVPRDREYIPRYADVTPLLADALEVATSRGLAMGGFESMCGIPLCLVPSRLDRFLSGGELPPGFDRGEFVKTEECDGCALADKCYGLRRGYAEIHGASELSAVRAPAAPVAG